MKTKINLDLSREEALVLFDWIARFNKSENSFHDQAEQRVLWNIEAMLESALDEPLDPEYANLLAQARAKVRDQET
jgi:hypothetical protein